MSKLDISGLPHYVLNTNGRATCKVYMCHFMKVRKKTFRRIQDNLLKNHICLHYTSLHYSSLQRSAEPRVKKQLNAKHWLPRENFLRQKGFFLWVAWSNYGDLDQLSTQKSNQNIVEKNKVSWDPLPGAHSHCQGWGSQGWGATGWTCCQGEQCP